MSEISTDSRNKKQKCEFNNGGFCKYRDKCLKHHYSEICRDQNCEPNCEKRHPKPCKHGGMCKLNKRKICAFSHDSLGQDGLKKNDESQAVLEGEIVKIKEDIEKLNKDNLNNTKIFNRKSDDLGKKLSEQVEKNKNLKILIKGMENEFDKN